MAARQYNTAQIRQALNIAFDDSTFSAFCFDHFLVIYDRFSRGLRKDEKITLLLDYCRRRTSGFNQLLEAVRQEYQMSNSSREELKPLIRVLEEYMDHTLSGREHDRAESRHMPQQIPHGNKNDAQKSPGFINQPTGSVTQVFGDQRNININGGDYAEGNIDKRVGIFIEARTTAPAPAETPPYTETDLRDYLKAVIEECKTIQLPYAAEGKTSLPLERIYVALQADRSSPVERRASHKLFKQLVDEQLDDPQGAVADQSIIYQIAAQNPYSARYRLYDEILRAELLAVPQEQERTYHLAEIVRTHRWLVLLGHPGSGKSTLARWLALQLARAVQSGKELVTVRADHVRPDGEPTEEEALGMARLPVLVRIADYAAARWQEGVDNRLSLRHYLGRHISGLLDQPERQAAIDALLDDYLAKGRVTFILDGLDEVTDPQQRNQIVASIEDLIRGHVCDAQEHNPLDHRLDQSEQEEVLAGNQLIVTSRIVGYQLRPLHENLPHFVIQPMDDIAVHRFCDNWVAASPNLNLARQLEVEGQALVKAVLEHSNPYVREQMGRNPLLLTILAQVFSINPQEGLPARRTQLYRKAKEAVFKQRPNQWGRLAQEMGGRDLERALERITAHVAFKLHANPTYPNSLVDHEQAQEWLLAAVEQERALKALPREPEDIANDLLEAAANLSGFFVARGEGVYGFLHRQFQEYFAARWLVRHGKKEAWQPFFDCFAKPNWQEVLFLTVGSLAEESQRKATALLTDILSNTDLDPTNGLLPHNTLFVAATMREGERWPEPLVKRVASALIQAYRRDDEARFEVVKEHVRRGFNGLPRPRGRTDPVGNVLISLLKKKDTERLTRLAAVELIIETKWYTERVARTLSHAWQRNAEPAGTILEALQALYDVAPTFLAQLTKQLRRQLTPHWQTIERYPHWEMVVRALYLAPCIELTQDAIIRNSPLSKYLLPLLQEAPEDHERLITLLRKRLTDQTTKRDAALALVYLGDASIVPALLAKLELPHQLYVFINSITLSDVKIIDLKNISRADAHADTHTHARFVARIDALVLADTRTRELSHIFELIAYAIKKGIHSTTLSSTIYGVTLENSLIKQFLQSGRGVVDVWKALVEAWDDGSDGEANWLKEARPQLSIERLEQLSRQVQKAEEAASLATLLPRLGPGQFKVLSDEAKAHVEAQLMDWLAADDPLIARHGALLLAEMGTIVPASLPKFFECLQDANDLTRYRAQETIIQKHPNSELGRQTIEGMAQLYSSSISQCTDYSMITTYLSWLLREIEHDCADWLQAWAEAGQTIILSNVHRLNAKAWSVWLDLLTKASPIIQEALLYSTSWLLRFSPYAPDEKQYNKNRLTNEQISQLVPILMLMAKTSHGDETVRLVATKTLGYLPHPDLEVVRELLTHLPQEEKLQPKSTIYQTLARLAVHCKDNTLRHEVRAAFMNALPNEKAAAALVRLVVTEAIEKEKKKERSWAPEIKAQTNATLLQQLRQWLTDDQDLLHALLEAGTDDDRRDEYHERLVALACNVVQRSNDELLPSLLHKLEQVLDEGRLPAIRIRLATVTACARVMGDALNSARSSEELEELLVRGTRTWGDYDSRRFAITALSHLRMATPAIMEALLEAARDVSIVQEDAIRAAGNFQRLSQEFDHDKAWAPLIEALTGESQATAYLAAQLLAALGSSPAVLSSKTLRQRIADILSEALHHPNAKREVHVFERERIESKGTLARTLYKALAQVVALPE